MHLRPFLTVALLASVASVASGQLSSAEYSARRSALAAKLDDGVLIARGSPEPERDYESFFQNSTFAYLTGYREPGATLVMQKKGGSVSTLLFVEAKNPAVEVWSGRRHGIEGATKLTGVPTRTTASLATTLDSLLAGGKLLYVVGDYDANDKAITADDHFVKELVARRPSLTVKSVGNMISTMRGTKSPAELELIRKAVEITVDAHKDAARAWNAGMNEFEIQALIEYTFRRNGADRPSFATIVGSGPNSTILHYNANDRFTNAGDVVVMDIGASYRGYAADVTRTLPVNGKFSPEQREVYTIVRAAQKAAEERAKPGARAQLMSEAADSVLAAGLTKLGLIEGPGATYDCGGTDRPNSCPQLSLFYMHGLGHGIGLDVHDPDQYYFTGIIARGSAFTLEPGIYVRENLLDIIPKTPRNAQLLSRIAPAVRKYANIGVRIEDDYIVTDKGTEWISRAPREIDEVEALMQQRFAGPAPRDSAKVEWYRKQ